MHSGAPTISSHFCLFLLKICWYCRCWAYCKSLDNWYIILRSGIVLCSSSLPAPAIAWFSFLLLRFAFQLLLRFDSIYCGGRMTIVPQYECTRVANCLIRSSSSSMVLIASDACLDSIRLIALLLSASELFNWLTHLCRGRRLDNNNLVKLN